MFSNQFRTATAAVAFAAAATLLVPQRASAYPIDCAILLCLAGGWPASTECSSARAEFIRRITPWPIEPPLQIWRCPMHTTASLNRAAPAPGDTMARLVSMIDRSGPSSSLLDTTDAATDAVFVRPSDTAILESILHLVQAEGDPADVDISGPDFDFVRSIRVWHVVASQRQGRDDCNTYDNTRLGQYSTQGQYHWQRSHLSTLPPAFGHNPTGWCASYSYRAVFVDWRDHEGNYGFERVDY